MKVRVASLVERFRSSLFFVPMLAVVFAVVLAAVSIAVDSNLVEDGSELPLGLGSTVESARALLGTVAGATITFAGIAFSVSLLIIQQASSQFSPRVVHTLFRDPFNKRVMALVVGTFTFCLLILRSVRSPLDEGGDAVIPNLSVAIAVVLGIATILAVVAFIDHSAHSMDISNILHDVEREAVAQIRREWPAHNPDAVLRGPPSGPSSPGHIIAFTRSGWVQQIDIDQIVRCLPKGQTVWVETYPGRYAIPGTPICTLSAPPADVDETARAVRGAVEVGQTRTMQQDVSFGIRQLTDVALKALSPGINDPTTAQDAIFHSTAVIAELLQRDPPDAPAGGPNVVMAQQPTHSELIDLAFDEVRQAASTLPIVCIYLLESLHLLLTTTPETAPEPRIALERQARLVVAGAAAADNLAADIRAVDQAHAKRFASHEN